MSELDRAACTVPLGLSAKAFAEAAGTRLALAELVPPGALNLRGDLADHGFVSKACAVLGCELPRAPNSVQSAGELTVLWLGPDEWLVLTAPGGEISLAERLEEALLETHVAVTDVSGNRAHLRLKGAAAREVLAKGCPLDLHPRMFKPGSCAQTVLARTSMLLHLLDDAPTFDLFPRRSFAPYVVAWLVDAMRDHEGVFLNAA
ncbi:sarcosine oxidase subunit gamma [Arboricoccus pini]|nr:sarcosine oxidase subunit gamma family protein [Arboricoccus pini]